jgi:L-threonylcarbamoyladenylate synthase
MSQRLSVQTDSADQAIAAAVAHLQKGGIVAFPTDTFYGLAVDPRSEDAVAALFALKRRDPDVALPLIAASLAQAERAVGPITPLARLLASEFWPGPLTLVLDAHPSVAPAVHAGLGTIAVRVPAHPVARALADRAGYPITATSANRSGEPPAATADAALAALDESPAVLLLDAGTLPPSPPSTIVDARGRMPVLLREGAVPWERVLEFLGHGVPPSGRTPPAD